MAKETADELEFRVGLLGELQVEQQLVLHGWHPVRLDTGQMAANADLIAVRRKKRVLIQVKSTGTGDRHQWLSFGYASSYLKNGTPFFNSKRTPLLADVLVAAAYHYERTRYVVMPIAVAEALCRSQADWWYAVPTGAGKQRSASFPIYLAFNANRKPHAKFHERMKRNVSRYEGRWDILEEPIDKLHDAKAWPLLK